MHDIAIREGTMGDAENLTPLMERFDSLMAALDPHHTLAYRPEAHTWFATGMFERADTRHGKVYVAEHDNVPIGFIAGHIEDAPEGDRMAGWPSPHGHISEFYIEEAFRNQNIGTRLLELMERFFHEAGIPAITLDVFPFNANARALYVKRGYLDTEIRMTKRLHS